MNEADIVAIAQAVARQMDDTDVQWSPSKLNEAVQQLLERVPSEKSAYKLGEVLRCDRGLHMPIDVIRATYQRLLVLGVTDARTRICYARYLLLHGPEWDAEAQAILKEVEAAARAAGLWDSPTLGHHPVFYNG